MKQMLYISTAGDGTVSEGWPLVTTQPWGDDVTPYVLLGYWYKQRTGDNSYKWVHTGIQVQVEAGVPLSIENGGVVCKAGEFRRETSGLWIRKLGEPQTENDALVWFANYNPSNYFTTGDAPTSTYQLSSENCDVHYCGNDTHLVATVKTDSVIAVEETRPVRKAGTGRSFFNFPKFEDLSRGKENLRIGKVNAPAIQEALRAGRPVHDMKIEMYKFAGTRDLLDVQSSWTKKEVDEAVTKKGYKRYSEVVA